MNKLLDELMVDKEPSAIPLDKPPTPEEMMYNFKQSLFTYITNKDVEQINNMSFGYNLGKFCPSIQSPAIFIDQLFGHFSEIINHVYEVKNIPNPTEKKCLASIKLQSEVLSDLIEKTPLKTLNKRDLICCFAGLVISYLEQEIED